MKLNGKKESPPDLRITFTIPGSPVPKGRPRFYNGRAVTPPKTREYEEFVAWVAKTNISEATQSPVKVSLRFVLPIPASWSAKKREAALAGDILPAGKPDGENLSKSVCDAMNGIAYRDDGQIVDLHITKHYGEPHVTVTIETL